MHTQPLPVTPSPPVDPLIGQRLGDFVVEEPLAAGGMGVVYRARHPLIGRLAAIKVLKPEIAADRDQTDRFLKEAQALAAIKHRGIIEIIGFGNTDDGRQYMATEFLEGEPLEKIIGREAPMPAMRVLALIDEVLNALSAAHKSQVVHRDLKPSNVFLATQSTGERIVKVLDFGLAKQSPVTLAEVVEGPLGAAKASLVAGTPEYIAPEQARGFAATPRTDLYCVGVMMFEMLSGSLPFKSDTIIGMLKQHVYELPPRLSSRASNLPPALEELVMQLLEKDPDKRPPSAEIVRQSVQRIMKQLQQESTVQRPNPLQQLRVVPAPFRTAESEAPTPPLDPKMITTEPVIRPIVVAPQKPRRTLWPLMLLILLPLLGGIAWILTPGEGSVDRVAPPKVKEGATELHALEVVRPSPPAAVAVAAEPSSPEESLPALRPGQPKVAAPAVEKSKTVTIVLPPPQASVLVTENSQCANLTMWRQDELELADEDRTRARDKMVKQGMSSDAVETELATLAPVRVRIEKTANGDECKAATIALTDWGKKHGL